MIQSIFDEDFYISEYPDVATYDSTPLFHFARHGASEGRIPNLHFDPLFYNASYQDVSGSGLTPIEHYIKFGMAELRHPCIYFDPAFYIQANQDVDFSRTHPFAHYVQYGTHERRKSSAFARGPFPNEKSSSPDETGRPRPNAFLHVTLGQDSSQSKYLTAKSPRILFIDDFVPIADEAAGALRTYEILQILNEMGSKVTFAGDCKLSGDRRYRLDLELQGLEVITGEEETVAAITNPKNSYDLIWICRWHLAAKYLPLARAFQSRAKVVFDTIDLHWVRLSREAVFHPEISEEEIARTKKSELLLSALSNAVVTCSDADRNTISQELPCSFVTTIPIICETNSTQSDLSQRSDLVFLGGFRHRPNVDGVQYFIDECFPEIIQNFPSIRLNVLGSHLEEISQIYPTDRVILQGFVPQADIFLQQFRVMVAPLRYGAGMKGKIVSALSNGLPVVTTSVGAEGMYLVDGETALIRDSPEEFSEAVAQLLADDDLWRHLSQNGQQHVDSHFSSEITQSSLSRLLESLWRER